VRGGPAKLTKGDRRPYLEAKDAEKLLLDALKRYLSEHHKPARPRRDPQELAVPR
jgi:hypothetical protein